MPNVLFYVADSTPAGIGGIDEYTKLMLHMDGSDDGAVFTDDSLSPKTVTPINAVTKTAIKKFGTAGGYFNGSSDYLSVPDSDDFYYPADMTIDFWLYVNGITGNTTQHILSQSNSVGSDLHDIWLFDDGVGHRRLRWREAVTSQLWAVDGNVDGLTNGSWHHIACERYGTLFTVYFDGVSVGTTTYAPAMANHGHILRIGRSGYTPLPQYYNGYIDELRISKGIARWTTDFTPESGPYTT